MINKTELRLDNWVYSTLMEDYFQISELSMDYNPTCEPIRLSPEILESAGFEWETTEKKHLQLFLPDQDINKRNISFLYLDGECKMLQLYMSDYFDGYFEIKPPKHIHQLQNLYFALTNTELEINLQTITKCHTPKTTNS